MIENQKSTPAVRTESVERGYEVSDANARGIFIVGISALVVGILIHLVYWRLFLHFKKEDLENQVTDTAFEHNAILPPEPRLQLNPHDDLKKLREKNQKLLTSAAWTDRKEGWARIPIDDAMDLLLQEQKAKVKSK